MIDTCSNPDCYECDYLRNGECEQFEKQVRFACEGEFKHRGDWVELVLLNIVRKIRKLEARG